MTEAPLEQLTVRLYDPGGAFNRVLDQRMAAEYQDVLTEAGSGAFMLHNEDPDAAVIQPRSIVKFHFLGAERFGARVGREGATYSDDGILVTWSCLGLLGALLSDGILLPETGTTTSYTGDRWFGWMADSFDDSSWSTSISGYQYGDSVNLSASRLGHPVEWPDPGAYWIRSGTSPGSGTQLFRSTVTLTADDVCRIYTSVDESITVYFDGEELYHRDYDEVGFTEMQVYDLGIVKAGTHQIAIYMRVKATPIKGDGLDAVMFTMMNVDASNAPSTVLRRSDLTNWKQYTTTTDGDRPGMPRAAAIRTMVLEAQARGVGQLSQVTLGFTATTDSNSQPWDDQVVMSFPVMKATLDEIAFTLAEATIDLWFDAATMTLHAYKRKGSDKSLTVAVTRGVNVIEGEQSTKELAVVNDLYGQLSDGTFVKSEDSASITAYGRVERGVSIGATTRGSGQALLAKVLTDLVAPVTTLEAPHELVGAVPYTDYVLGDTISAPAHRSATNDSARVLGITVTQGPGEDGATAYPQLVPDPDGAL